MPDEAFPQQALDLQRMDRAIRLAQQAAQEDEVPIGCVIYHENDLIGQGYNQRETLHDPTAHAEMIAITAAAEALGRWRLSNCTVYVTCEPCVMCAGALILARVRRVVYGCADPKWGAAESLYRVLEDGRLNHRVETIAGIRSEECAHLLQEFFRGKRKNGASDP